MNEVERRASVMRPLREVYAQVGRVHGWLDADRMGARLGSTALRPAGAAERARAAGRLVAVRVGRRLLYPGFQLGADGRPLPAVARLVGTARECGLGEEDLVTWLCEPTAQLGGAAPVSLLADAPDRVVAAARDRFEVPW